MYTGRDGAGDEHVLSVRVMSQTPRESRTAACDSLGHQRKPALPAEGVPLPGAAQAVGAPSGPAVTSAVSVHLEGLRVGPAPAWRRARSDPPKQLRDTLHVAIAVMGGDAGAYRADTPDVW